MPSYPGGVEEGVAAVEEASDRLGVADVADHLLDPRGVVPGRRQQGVGRFGGQHQQSNRVAGGEERQRGVGADVSGAAGDRDLHVSALFELRCHWTRNRHDIARKALLSHNSNQ